MKKQHKWHKEITHWANGGAIQFKMPVNPMATWKDYEFSESDTPAFENHDFDWRIKPNTKDFRYRVAIMQDDLDKPEYWANSTFSEAEAKVIESEGAFLTWLTDWKTVKDVEL